MDQTVRERPILQPGAGPDFAQQVSFLINRRVAHVGYTIGAEAGNVRRVSMQVRDRHGKAWSGRWVVLFYVAATADGNPVATQTVTVPFATGVMVQEVVANQTYLGLTSAAGLLEFDVTIAGAATRHFYGLVLDSGRASGAVAWA